MNNYFKAKSYSTVKSYSKMKSYPKVMILLGSMLLMTACEVDKTEEGEMPKVSVQGGQMPEYEVKKTQEGELPDVDVDAGKMPKYDVKGPDIEVGTETKEVTVPTVDIDLPEDDDEKNKKGISATERDE